jgi:uncharacterized protein YjbJ (UPF0337 family)
LGPRRDAAKQFQQRNLHIRADVSPYDIENAAVMKEDAMNWDRVEGNWKQMTGKVKEQWGKLTDDDITVIGGRQEQLVGRIQERYGIAKDEAQRQIDNWMHKL